MSRQIVTPFEQFFDSHGTPLDNGSVYIGTTNLNPETSPVQVYWDDARTIPAAQPIKTSGGYMVRNGTPARVFADVENYSMTVKDKKGRIVWTVSEATSTPTITGTGGAALVGADDGAGGTVYTTIQGFLTKLKSSIGSSLMGFIQSGTGAVARTVQDELRDRVSVFQFMTPAQIADVQSGAATMDVTAAIQAAINFSSKNGWPEVTMPCGIYSYTRLYNYYDASLNPGFNATKMGRVRIIGAGRLQHAEANNWPSEGWHGTVLLSSVATGDCFNVSPAGSDGGSYPSRENTFENLTLIGNTTGFVVKHHCAISSQMRDVTVLQLNAAGSGVYWHSGWFTKWDTVWVSNLSTTGQTGVGVDFGATLFAGSFRFSNCCFERFRDGFQVNESTQSVALLFDGVCTFQSNARDGLQLNAAIRSLVMDTPYLEFNGRSHVRCTLSSGSIQSLSIRGGFALGGTSSATSMTGAMVYLRNVTNWSIDGLAVYRPWTDIVDVAWYSANGTAGAIKNTCVDASDNTPSSVIYLSRVNDQRAMPVFEGNTLIGATQVKEFDESIYMVNSKQGILGVETFALSGPVNRKTLGLNDADYLQSTTTGPLTIYNVQGGGALIALPGEPGTGRKLIIASQVASVASVLVRQSDATTNLVTLAAGQAVECYFEPTANKWVAVGPVAFAGV